uniref:Zinc finger protein 2-like n=1 Tax=Poecilia formosa TaxID=48698 RepID=A0A096LR70_POEFO
RYLYNRSKRLKTHLVKDQQKQMENIFLTHQLDPEAASDERVICEDSDTENSEDGWRDDATLWKSEEMAENKDPSSSSEPQGSTDLPQFGCQVCGITFQKMGYLITHAAVHQETETTFRCSVCGQSFTLRGNLRIHMKIHSGERPHSCSICSKSFGRRASLVRHVRSHMGEKPFACMYCGHSFTEKGNLTVHLRTHTGERPYRCSRCARSFKYKRNSQHDCVDMTLPKVVDSYVCTICGQAFYQRSQWAKHTRIHRKVDGKGDKSFTCDICGKRLTRSDGYQKHLRVHTGEKPYSCHVCGRSFSDNSNFKRHIRRHMKE